MKTLSSVNSPWWSFLDKHVFLETRIFNTYEHKMFGATGCLNHFKLHPLCDVAADSTQIFYGCLIVIITLSWPILQNGGQSGYFHFKAVYLSSEKQHIHTFLASWRRLLEVIFNLFLVFLSWIFHIFFKEKVTKKCIFWRKKMWQMTHVMFESSISWERMLLFRYVFFAG